MKKNGKFMFMFFLSTMIIAFTGCKPEVEEHEHTFAKSWTSDAEYHWHAATCGHNIKGSKEAHTEDEGEVTTATTCVTRGERTYKCKICKVVLRTEEIPELYSSPVDAETGNAATTASKYIYFGVFPKTVLPENSAVTVDETVTVVIGANTYHKGNDGNYYAKVTENCCDSSGYTYSDGTTVKQSDAASTRYFKVEPINWKVLTNDYNGTGKALLLAEDILTANVPYYVSTSSRTIGGNTVYVNNYKYSTIRAYLNGTYESDDTQNKTYEGKGFLQTAFTANARLLISATEVDNRAETTGYDESTYANKYYCENTSDKIFLLSASEVNGKYGFAAYDSYGKGNARIRATTDYAKANYAYQNTTAGYGGYWWLRSPYCNSYYARYVDSDGDAKNVLNSIVSITRDGVVPALSISLQ